jgi:hypothetical protein
VERITGRKLFNALFGVNTVQKCIKDSINSNTTKIVDKVWMGGIRDEQL